MMFVQLLMSEMWMFRVAQAINVPLSVETVCVFTAPIFSAFASWATFLLTKVSSVLSRPAENFNNISDFFKPTYRYEALLQIQELVYDLLPQTNPISVAFGREQAIDSYNYVLSFMDFFVSSITGIKLTAHFQLKCVAKLGQFFGKDRPSPGNSWVNFKFITCFQMFRK